MAAQTRQLHLNTNVLASGRHDGAWRLQEHPGSDFLDIDYYCNIARIAERGTFDAVFLADGPALGEEHHYRPWHCLEPTVLLASVAAATDYIGLVGTASTSFNHPYNIARRFASLDHVTRGRTAWNIVTTQNPDAAGDFGMSAMPSHEERYARAQEFTEVVLALWDSWEDDAISADRDTGVFTSPTGVRPIDHVGEFFSVTGPLNVPRSPQGRPVVVQAGASDASRHLGARFADALFTVQRTLEDAVSFYRELKGLARGFGRNPDHLLVFPGLYPVIGGTEEEAWARKEEMDEQLDFEAERDKLAVRLGIAPEDLQLDRKLPYDLLEAAVPKGSAGFSTAIASEARRHDLSVRQLLGRNVQGGHRLVVGSPEQIADDIEAWFLGGAADGFNLNSDDFPSGLEAFVDHVVPVLRRRGLFRNEYSGPTFRDHLGLPKPIHRFDAEFATGRFDPVPVAD